ncbi:MICOS complex subunit Mic27, partial [Biomphalaria pfeifferi]
SKQIFRLVIVAGTVPVVGIAVGYRMRSQHLVASAPPEKRLHKIRELPLYPVNNKDSFKEEPFPRNVVEAYISSMRKSVVDFFSQYEESFKTFQAKTQTSIDHSKATLDYIQNNPGELPRVIFIAVAGMGGVVLGYRGGAVKKLTYGTIAGLSCASLCYPKKSVELANQFSDNIHKLWKESGVESSLSEIWPQTQQGQDAKVQLPQKKLKFMATEVSYTPPAAGQLQGDLGQSNPEDKDMYSTRSS